MLGFSAFAAAPLSSPGGVSVATTLASQVINQVVNTLTLEAKANKTITSISSASSINSLGFDAEANVTPSAVISASSINTLDFVAEANITPSAITASFAEGTLGFVGLANKEVTATPASFTINNVDFDAEANVTPSATTATTTLNNHTFTLTAAITPSAATAVNTAGTAGFDAKAITPALSGLSSVTGISALDFDAKANITTSSVNLATTVVDITPFLQVGVATELASLLARLSINLDPPANNLFDYDAVADDFSRTRTVYILPEDGYGLSKTVHIPQQDNPVISLINPSLSLGKTTHINPENFTLVVDKHRGLPTTVLITR